MSHSLAHALIRHIEPLQHCVVAFSGGVDSSVIAMAAYRALGQNSLAMTAVSPSVSSFELENARSVAKQMGIRHEVIQTREIENPAYVANNGSRCFYCKSELYSKIKSVSAHVQSGTVLLNGTNLDDLGDYRPGLQAAEDFGVRSPFVDLEIGKADVRQLARYWEMDVAEKPAAPCLASRIAYGQAVTTERLAMIEKAEAFVRSLGFAELRVRYHENDHARIEVPTQDVSRLEESQTMLDQNLRKLGFQSIEIDPLGLRSGNLNQALPIFNSEQFNAEQG